MLNRGVVALWCILAAATGVQASITVSQNGASIPRYDIFEITVVEGGSYANPWEDVSVTATFQAPSGATFQVGGFYYDTHTWKVRFAPNETGAWTWSLIFQSAAGQAGATGGFTAVASSNRGFLRRHPANPYRFLTEGDGRAFYPIGFDSALSGYYTMDGSGANVGIDAYFDTYAAAGNNIFRILINRNNSPWLVQTLNAGGTGKNTYDPAAGKAMDTVVVKLHQDGYQVFMTVWGAPPANGSLGAAGAQTSVLHYHKYVLDRYGAYVSVWELMNEQTVPASYYNTVIPYLRGYDAYQHLLSTSDPQPALNLDVDITSPHRYYNAYNPSLGGLDPAVGYLADTIAQWKGQIPNKPILFGEAGIQDPYNYDPLGYRIWLWTAFFNEGGLMFWNTSYKKTFATNQYMGPEERGFSKFHSDFIADFDAAARPVNVAVTPSSQARAYALSSPAELGVYFLSWNFNSTVSGATVTLNVPSAGMQAEWYDPATGALVGQSAVAQGTQTLPIPNFLVDIVLRIRAAAAACVNPPSIPQGFAAPCPALTVTPPAASFSGGLTISSAPSLRPAWVLPQFYIFDSGRWLPAPVPGWTSWCFGGCSLTLPAAALRQLAPGSHAVASWDWSWNGACWVGPGGACGQGNWRYQTFTVQ
jgi:hypothetical protein